MTKRHSIINFIKTITNPVFFAPLTLNAYDIISGNEGSITGANQLSYTPDGVHFRGTASSSGVQYIDWNSGYHSVTSPSLNQSMTFLCDFKNDSSSGHNAVLVFQKNSSSRFVSLIYNNRRWAAEKIGSGNVTAQLTSSISANTWYNNSGFCWNADKGELQLILNGEVVKRSTISSLPDYSNPQIRLGWADDASNYFKGYLKNVRIYNKAYSSSMNFDDTIDSNTILYIKGDTSTISDISSYNNTVTNTNVTFQDNAMYFNGSAMLNVDIGNLKITDGVFTLEMWVKLDNINKNYKCVADFCNHQVLYFDASDNRDGTIVLVGGQASWQSSGSYLMSSSKNVFLTTSWQHVAIVGDGSKTRMYVNGIEKTGNYFESCTNTLNMGNGKIRFGNIALNNTSRYFRGYMRNIKLSNVARYTGNFTPPTY